MAKLGPVAHDARLTLTEHLGELRTRLLICVAGLVIAFGFSYWQNAKVLEIINKPLHASQELKPCSAQGSTRKADSLEQSACFDRAVADALQALQPVVSGMLQRADGSATTGQNGEQRSQSVQDARLLKQAANAIAEAKRLAPTSTTERNPVTLGVTEPFFQTMTVTFYAALIIVLPLILYQIFAFLLPAFTPREQRAVIPAMFMVPLLFYSGAAFCYFAALPRAVDFLQNFNDQSFDILIQAKDYNRFVAMLVGGTGLLFEVPILVVAVSRMGILSAAQMRKNRGIVIVAAAVVSAIITPTPDPLTMLIVMAPIVILFEVSVFAAGLLEKRRGGGSRWDLDDEDLQDDDLAAPATSTPPQRPSASAPSAQAKPPAPGSRAYEEPDWRGEADDLDEQDPYA